MNFTSLKQKKTRWTLSGVSKEAKEIAQKNAKKEDISVSSYVERALIQALELKKHCQEIDACDDIKSVAGLLSKIDKRLSTLEKVAANSEHVD